jgi:membrane protease YdiL (CAAX protease family)
MNTTETIRPASRWLRLLHFPIVRILLATLFLGAGLAVTQVINALLGRLASPQNPLIQLASITVALLALYGSYKAYVHGIERRPAVELSFQKAGWELSAGLLAGIGLFGIIIAILWLLGVYHVTGWNSWTVIITALVLNLPSGFLQELFFRGVVFRIVNESLGTVLALVISALLFGLIHLFSAHATLTSTLSIATEAGVLLAAAYLLTGRLWLPIGIHIGWDMANDGIFGVGSAAISGVPIQGLLRATLTGPAILTGGANGVEASLVTFLVVGVVCVFLLKRVYMNRNWVVGPGRRKSGSTGG